jgi:hypothetical protein
VLGGLKYIAEPFMLQPSASEFELAIGKLKSYKSLGVDKIVLIKLFQAGEEKLRSEIHKLIKLNSKKEELPHQWKESVVEPVHKKGDKTDCGNYRSISFLSNS